MAPGFLAPFIPDIDPTVVEKVFGVSERREI